MNVTPATLRALGEIGDRLLIGAYVTPAERILHTVRANPASMNIGPGAEHRRKAARAKRRERRLKGQRRGKLRRLTPYDRAWMKETAAFARLQTVTIERLEAP